MEAEGVTLEVEEADFEGGTTSVEAAVASGVDAAAELAIRAEDSTITPTDSVVRHPADQEVCPGAEVDLEAAIALISREKAQVVMMIENLNGPGTSLQIDDRGILSFLPVTSLLQGARTGVFKRFSPFPMAPISPPEYQLYRTSSSPDTQLEKSPISPSAPEAPPKRKRGRLTKEQLAQLERLFAADCSPTVARRREISAQVGCPERQIQVWYQNSANSPSIFACSRRAKAKNTGEKCKTRPRVPSPVKEPPELCQAIQTDLAMLIQEDDSSVFTIPCTTLTIGGWNRVNFEDENDLLAWICEKKRCFTWFVRSDDYSFKMQVALDSLKELAFKNAEPGKAFLTLEISSPPSFFLRRNLKREFGVPPPCWRRCEDWTENKVASRNLRHVLGGPALPLANVVTYIKSLMEDAKPVSLHSVDYPAPTDTQISSHQSSTSISTTPTYPSPFIDDNFYLPPQESRSWDSLPCSNSRTPMYDTKSPPQSYDHHGLNHSRTHALPYGNRQYGDIHAGHDEMRLLGTDVGPVSAQPERLSPLLQAPQPRQFYPETAEVDTVAHFQPANYYQPYPPTGHQQQPHSSSHPLPHFSELFSPVRDSF
ncbi:hypothetical protein NP233_g7827 [Leucocoprinus birnbaumii]|uniref:Visual system homeobox 1 n=1 Tax=Leucocoprinus birnbaumii TaxID=56174 RepID=A0AAD5VNJ7_9AGAR|nr:hypothetical protein NP233_g7827 [Leucocoprinus birnbaumii]